jgi:XTP/dITP diphosphohydrolase
MARVEIVVASMNEKKAQELNRLCSEPRLHLVSMRAFVPPGFEVEETGATFEENAWLKALHVCEVTGMPALADDSGLEVDALGGRPGVYSARYARIGASDQENNQLLLRELSATPHEKRTARFRCVLAFAAPGAQGPVKVASVDGVVEGRIATEERGRNGFGYDPLFLPLEFPGRTTAEISPEEKDRISHRGAAARALLPRLIDWLRD